jgi:glycosyltransferase involved in cell wall biosynthesis
MKILWLAQYPIDQLLPEIIISKPLKRGTTSWLVNLSNELSKNDSLELHMLVVSASVPYSQSLSKNNIHFHIVKYNFPFIQKGFPPYLPLDKLTWYAGLKKKCYKIINDIQPDLIHAHGTEHVHALVGVKSGFTTIISIQGIINVVQKYDKNLSGFFQNKIEHYCVKNAKHVGFRTNFDSDFIRTVNPAAKLYYLPEAIGPQFFEYSWKNNSSASILFVGILLKRKGIEVLIRSLELVKKSRPDVVLKIIGAGKPSYLDYLKNLSVQLGIAGNIIWVGSKNSTEIAEELTLTSIYVLPTFIDNSPNSLAEAMAVGVPCIASDVGGIPSMIKDGFDGILAKSNDISDLADKIIALLNDRKLQNEISINAKNTARERNYPPKVAEITLDAYKQLING